MPRTDATIHHPAKYIPLTALAIGVEGANGVPVSQDLPLPCSEKPLSAARALIPDTAVTPGLAVLVDCSSAGKIVFRMVDETLLPLTFAPGVTMLPFAVSGIEAAGTSAEFQAWVLA